MIWALCTFVISVWVGAAAYAQDDTEPVAQDPAANDAPLALGDFLDVDYAAWDSIASRAEELLVTGVASAFALDRLRLSLTTWREVFAAAMRENGARLNTLDSQLVALGDAPVEGASEAAVITSRRATLTLQRDALAAPGLLAAEAHARAAGLISEIEAQLRDRQTQELLQRGPTPLNPALWPNATAYLWDSVAAVLRETTAQVIGSRWSSESVGRLLWSVIVLGLAGVLFVRGWTWARMVQGAEHGGAQHALREFVSTILQAIFPLLGLTALIYGLSQLDVFGPRGEAVLRTVPVTGSIIILGAWLGRQFFPEADRYGPLQHPHDISVQARRIAIALAWVSALWLPFRALLDSGPENETALALLNVPFVVLLSLILYRFAGLLRQRPDPQAGEDLSTGRTRAILARVTQVVAIVSVIAATAGYDAAAQFLLFPSVLTLGLLGVMVYLQTLSSGIYDLVKSPDGTKTQAFVPVVIGFVLCVIAIPLVALIWGASTADLWGYWVRFTEGFRFGQVTISPSDFIAFVAIFSLGYFLTSFVKNALRNAVLPRTSLDLGAQDAIVAGFGYVGIFLAAVVAITSAGIDLSSLAIVAGALSVGIGFGLQTIVSNFVSGIILLIERPVGQGDWIEVGGHMGFVRAISVRSTRIETFDRSEVIVPNADLISNQVINWTRGNLAGRIILPIGVAYGTDVDKVAGILQEIAEAHPMVIMTPPPAVLFLNFGADALEFEIRAILRDVNFSMSARSELNLEISRRFAAENIEIPFAQRDIWLRNPEVLRQTEAEVEPDKSQTAPFVQRPQADAVPDSGET